MLAKTGPKTLSPRQRVLLAAALVSLIIASAIAALAQPAHPINPKTGIAWPGNCTGANNSYNVVTGQCMTTGTAANPAGLSGQGQYNQSNSFAASARLTFDVNGFPSILGNVNSMVNVFNYGAKGDCTTDDTAAFTSAQTAAEAFAVGNSLPGAIILPKPPGGCYIVNDFVWRGVSIVGLSPTGIGPASPKTYGITLKNSPGAHDIFHVPDPSLNSGSYRIWAGWNLSNLGFIVDNSAGGTRPHRWPGRWFDDGAMTNGSAVFTSSSRRANITCADVGQAIQVNGAGVAGANLVTTIQSVSPCWLSPTGGWQVVTLAAAASTTVTNAHSYISVLGLPVTQTLGNAAIAQDLYDGNPANWIGSLNTGNYGRMENISFTTTNGSSNTSPNNYPVGMFTQGIPWFYGLDASQLLFNGFYVGIGQTAPELNSFFQSDSGDYEKWSHGLFFFNVTPWLSYNGLAQHLEDLQITGYAGPLILGLANQAFDTPVGWTIQNMGFEAPTGNTAWGWVVTGGYHNMNVSLTSHAVGQFGYFEANTSECDCDMTNVYLDGFGNRVNAGGLPTGFVERGINNEANWNYNGNPFNGNPNGYNVSIVPYKGDNRIVGRFTGDFVRDGNSSTPYTYDDLMIWPQDLIFPAVTGWANVVVSDSTSPSGYYALFHPGDRYNQFNQFEIQGNTSNSLVVGTNLPSTGMTVAFLAKCPSNGNFRPSFQTFGGTIVNPLLSCTTSYQLYAVDVPWVGGDVGKPVYLGMDATSPQNTYVGWFTLIPYRNIKGSFTGTLNGLSPAGAGAGLTTGPTSGATSGDPACMSGTNGQIADCGKPLAGSGAGFTTGPTGGTTANHVAVFSGTNGQIADSGLAVGATGTTGSIGGGALTAGQCTTGTASILGFGSSGAATASPVTDPGAGFSVYAYVSASNTITVKVCAIVAGTPTASAYKVVAWAF